MSQHSKKDANSHAPRNRKQQQQHRQQQQQQPQHVNAVPGSNTPSNIPSAEPVNQQHRKTNGSTHNMKLQQQQLHKLEPQQKSSAVKLSPSSASSSSSSSSASLQRAKKRPNKTQKDKERAERETLVLWRRPILTVKYCAYEIVTLLQTSGKNLLQQRALLAAIIVLGSIFSVICYTPGPHQALLELLRKNTWFFVYWIGLGVLSSVGLGTGLHTFLLYLGPHIASVTLAAYECNSLNFPRPPYPDDIICPEEPYTKRLPNLWSIMSKVRLEAFLWGAGTALGELPPYFMAKAARLSGYDPEDAEEMAEFEALKAKSKDKNLSLMDKGKLFMERVVERVGFFGILACASIPNPLFDLAGITCGHFLVPFWTFFGATLIGKAVIKMHLQKVFVIIAFNETLIERAVDLLAIVPVFGKRLQAPFKGFLVNQKMRLHRQRASGANAESGNLLSRLFETLVVGMICYFVISIVNSLAQNYHKRIHKKQPASLLLAPKRSKKRVAKE